MISWVTFWPFLLIPGLVMAGMGALVTLPVHGHLLGGEAVRDWCNAHLLLAWLPDSAAYRVETWLKEAPLMHQWILYLLVVMNVNALLLPFLYVAGEAIMRFHGWGVRLDLELKRRATRTGY